MCNGSWKRKGIEKEKVKKKKVMSTKLKGTESPRQRTRREFIVHEFLSLGETTPPSFRENFRKTVFSLTKKDERSKVILGPNWVEGTSFKSPQGFALLFNKSAKVSRGPLSVTKQGRGIFAARLVSPLAKETCIDRINTIPLGFLQKGEFLGFYENTSTYGYGLRKDMWIVARVGDCASSEEFVNIVHDAYSEEKIWEELLPKAVALDVYTKKKRMDLVKEIIDPIKVVIDEKNTFDIPEFSVFSEGGDMVALYSAMVRFDKTPVVVAESPAMGLHIVSGVPKPWSSLPSPDFSVFPSFTGKKPIKLSETGIVETCGEFFTNGKPVELRAELLCNYRPRDASFMDAELRLGRDPHKSGKHLVPVAVSMGSDFKKSERKEKRVTVKKIPKHDSLDYVSRKKKIEGK